MVICKIGEKEYNLPEGWNEVNLDKFEKIIKKNQSISEYKSQVLFGLEIFSILIDADIEDLKTLTKNSFEVLSKEIEWINVAPVGEEKTEFKIGNEIFRPLKDLNKLTMGDNISLELLIKDSDEANMLINILPVLLRKVKKVKTEDGEIEELEPFVAEKYNERKTLFGKSIFITDVINFRDFF
jgi:hypothetical protein